MRITYLSIISVQHDSMNIEHCSNMTDQLPPPYVLDFNITVIMTVIHPASKLYYLLK